METDLVVVHTIWAVFAILLIATNGYFLYASSYDRKQLHVFITGHLLCDGLLGIFVLFTSAQWLVIGIPEEGMRCDVLSMAELVLMTLPVLAIVAVTYSRKKVLLDEELVSGSPSNYVLTYFALAIVFNVVVVELVGATPTKFGCMPDWPSATVPVVFLVIGCGCLLWVFLCYLRIYRRVNNLPAAKFELQWKERQQKITLTTLTVATLAVLCYLPNISAAIILYLEESPPPALRVVQFTARLCLGLIVPFVYGIGVPSVRKRTMWALPEQKGVFASGVFPGNVNKNQINKGRDDTDSDLCYFPINQASSREQMEPTSRSSFSAKERSSFEQNSEREITPPKRSKHSKHSRQGSQQGILRTSSPNLARPEPFHDEGRSDIIWNM